MSTATNDSETSADPYFQSLFAERIGGAGYGKDTEIYKFEKIKRAKRNALADHPPTGTCWILESAKTIRWPINRFVM